MRRLFWMALGAAVGILAYRRAQRFMEESRDRGVVMTMQQVALSAAQTVASARSAVEGTISQAHKADHEGA
jgi:hypothetical protein